MEEFGSIHRVHDGSMRNMGTGRKVASLVGFGPNGSCVGVDTLSNVHSVGEADSTGAARAGSERFKCQVGGSELADNGEMAGTTTGGVSTESNPRKCEGGGTGYS